MHIVHPSRISFAALALVTALSVSPASAQITRVNVATDGTQANFPSFTAHLSGNGRFVAFATNASNLVAGDTNERADVFVRDLIANTTTRVSVTSAGTQGSHDSGYDSLDISDDGNVVAFSSFARLVADDTNECSTGIVLVQPCSDVYVHERSTGVTTRISVASDGAQADGPSLNPSLSADGRYVVFTSYGSNLVAGDTNGQPDVFLHDRTTHTTTRVSYPSGGPQGAAPSYRGVISGNGQIVAFVSTVDSFDGVPSTSAVLAAYVCSLSDHTIQRLTPTPEPLYVSAIELAISGDGSRVAVHRTNVWQQTGTSFEAGVNTELYDLPTGQSFTTLSPQVPGPPSPALVGVDLTADGRSTASAALQGSAPPAVNPQLDVTDTATWLSDAPVIGQWPSLSSDGRFLAFVSEESGLVAGDTNGVPDVFVIDRDPDGDGLPSTWETRFGFNPNDPADAAADPDGDGQTNLQEYAAHSHPSATQQRYFAEGAANAFFSTRLAILNPNASPATVVLHLLGSSRRAAITKTIAANSRDTFDLGTDGSYAGIVPETTFSTIVESDRPIVADRLTTWGTDGYGSSLETASEAPATTWYLAEGASGSPYSLYYLLENPGDIPAQAVVTYLLPSPQAPITKTHDLAARSRTTIDVTGEDAALAHAEVSAKITSTQPIVVERTMYLSTPSQFMAAGHAGAGLVAPATHWFLAEGATGFFDEYVLVANAEATDATLTVTYLMEGAPSFSEPITVAAHSRYTIDVKSRDTRLLSTPVSIVVESTNLVPVVVERAMWWPHGNWYEASLSAGVTATGTRWAMAEGEQGAPYRRSTYVLIANTDPAASGTATVTLYYEDGTTAHVTKALAPNSRTSVDIGAEFPSAQDRRFSIVVESSGVPIVVERALYQNIGDVVFAAGATAVATNITAAH